MARQKVVFTYHAPEAQSVSLAGDFTAWTEKPVNLKKLKSGTWKATLPLETGRYEYRYVVDGLWCDDPECQMRVPNPHGSDNCVRDVE
jgi:1,4-alpha-glucan branching enzyme